MTFLSYAQNFEDVMLQRALRDIKNGFYIDVGAQHPVNDSVTKAFYERGWRGINVDPVPQWIELLRKDRPHDINLQLAIGEKVGRKTMFAVTDTGLSTDNEAFVRRHRDAGYQAESLEVEVSTLDEVCERYGVSTVHFLKIDVEGAENDVIRGFSFDRVRPWIVLVEAIEPVTNQHAASNPDSVPSHQQWESTLLAHGYEFVYDDGLNRFYIARERQSLRECFALPPNPLDDYVRYQEWIKHERIMQLDDEVSGLIDARELAAKRVELQNSHDIRRVEQQERENLSRDSANRLQRIMVLEQENAALQGRLAAIEPIISDFRRSPELEQQLFTERNRGQTLQQELDLLRNRHMEQMERLNQLDAALRTLTLSLSWRVTKPLRRLRRVLGGPAAAAIHAGPIRVAAEGAASSPRPDVPGAIRRQARRYLLGLARTGLKYPALGRVGWRAMSVFPQTKSRLVSFVQNNRVIVGTAGASVYAWQEEGHLETSTEVAVVYQRMQAAIERRGAGQLDRDELN